MRKFLLFALFAVSAASQAQTPLFTPFAAPAPCMENFDSIFPGSYAGSVVFSSPVNGVIYALNTPNLLDIMAPPGWMPPANSLPNTCFGNGTDIGIRVQPKMRRFGAYFRAQPNAAGVAPGFAKVVFYDGAGNFMGSAGIALTGNFVYYGWYFAPPAPKFARIEIYSSAGPGGVEIDDMEVLPF